jgi:phenylpropionate dioxygenase-like ring-hydroxylating dioxygenase large terminal subunit
MMFDLLPNVWTPVLPIAEIETQPVAVELAGERIVLFRNSQAEIGALVDRCPHRGAALSLGRVSEDGCLECPYHGWQFDKDGACTHVPLNNPADLKLEKFKVASLPTRIIAGLVWVFTGQDEAPEPQLPDSLMRSADSYFIYHEVWNAHWTRLVENLMDYAHVPFVHRNSFGGEIVKNATPAGSFVEFQITQTERGVHFFNRLHSIESGLEIEPGLASEWYQPNLVVLKFDEMGMGAPIRMHSFAIPIDREHTRYLLAFELLEPYSADVAQQFLDPIVEDRITIESQIGEIPTTTGECNVPSDRVTLLFRRWYHQTFDRPVVQI